MKYLHSLLVFCRSLLFNGNILDMTLTRLNLNAMANFKLTFFSLNEFDSPDEIGSGAKMNKEFLKKLDAARLKADIPFRINSGYRTQEHNLKVGGVFTSAHKKGLAADIGYQTSSQRYTILKSLMAVGFNRLGIGRNFIHVDNDPLKDKDVIWTYKNK